MNIVALFDPTIVPPGTMGTFVSQTPNGGFIIAMNMSNVNISLQFANGATSILQANDRRKYLLKGQMSQPNQNINFTIQSQTGVPQSVNRIIIESYQPGECSPETYPSIFIRSAQVAN